MIDAGVEEIWSYLGTLNVGPTFNAREFACNIYCAMSAQTPSMPAVPVKAPFKIVVDTSDLEKVVANFQASVAELKAALEAEEPTSVQ